MGRQERDRERKRERGRKIEIVGEGDGFMDGLMCGWTETDIEQEMD